jgi:hypothetical protein
MQSSEVLVRNWSGYATNQELASCCQAGQRVNTTIDQ